MTAELEALLAERERDIDRLRAVYRFSRSEAEDFLDTFGPVKEPA
ncbi:hypothetical protein MASR1M8_16050 [Thermomonas brevis]